MIEIKKSFEEFQTSVKKHFLFLIDEYHFQLIESRSRENVFMVKYQSASVFVDILYGPPDYEPSLAFGRIGIDEPPGGYSYNLSDLFLLEQCSKKDNQNDQCSPLESILCDFVTLLRTVGAPCLENDSITYEAMKMKRDAISREWSETHYLNKIRQQASSAWERNDFREVERQYAVIESKLTKSESKKLSIARNRIASRKNTSKIRNIATYITEVVSRWLSNSSEK